MSRRHYLKVFSRLATTISPARAALLVQAVDLRAHLFIGTYLRPTLLIVIISMVVSFFKRVDPSVIFAFVRQYQSARGLRVSIISLKLVYVIVKSVSLETRILKSMGRVSSKFVM